MAEVITRLKVDSTEYDAKIKRAAQGLQHYVQSAHDSGDVIGRLLGDTKKYVESLGNMATVSTTARGRLNELTSAFTDLRTVYNSLSDEEKNAKGGFGQELNKQLEILKGRINDAKSELGDINKELGNTKESEQGAASGIQGLTSALGINLKTLTGWGTALAAGKVALDVAKDAFFASEASVDEWGRTVAASKSLYEGFLNAINNGDISGYLSRMNDIVTAARAAYDEMDKLGTMKTIQAPKISAQQTENERMRMMIQTGRYIAPVDGRRAAMKDGQLLTPEQIKTLERQLQSGMKTMVSLVSTEVKQTGKAIDAYYNSLAKQNGMSLHEFKKGTSSWDEFSKKMQGYEQYKEWDRQARIEFARQGGQGSVDFDKSNPFREFRKWGTFRVDKMGDNSYNQLVQLIQQRDQQASQAYSTQSQAYRAINRAEGISTRQLLGGGKGGHTTTTKQEQTELQQNQKKINDLTQQYVNLSAQGLQVDDKRLKAIQDEIKLLEERNGKLKLYEERAHGRLLPQDISLNTEGISKHGGLGLSPKPYDEKRKGVLSDDTMAKLTKAQEKQMNAYIKQARAMGKEQRALDKIAGKSQQFVSGLSAVAQGMKGMGIELPEGIDKVIGVISSVSSVIEGVSTIVSVFTTSALTANTIALEELTAVMLATSVIPGLQNGGIVPHAANGFIGGTHFSGDLQPVMVNAGEMILNKAQQNSLASQLSGRPAQTVEVFGSVKGENIILASKNYRLRTGRGEQASITGRR